MEETLLEEIRAEIRKLPPDERARCLTLAKTMSIQIQRAGFPVGPLALVLLGAIFEKELDVLDEFVMDNLNAILEEMQ